MRQLQSSHHNYGGNTTEESSDRQTGATHTSDDRTDGLKLNATPTYDRPYDSFITLEEAAGRPIADGGTEQLETTVVRCGGCERIFGRDGAAAGYTVEDTGEFRAYDEHRCPFCGTKLSYERTVETTATFDLPEVDR
ncbi:hypothetical protein ACFQGT_00325 [Natrialbaceae archaeon GCM10025810]